MGDIRVTEDAAYGGARVPGEAEKLVSEPFDVVHRVQDNDTLIVDVLLDITFQAGSEDFLLIGVHEVLSLVHTKDIFIDDGHIDLVLLLNKVFDLLGSCGLSRARDPHHYD